jgi:hypothetical protein
MTPPTENHQQGSQFLMTKISPPDFAVLAISITLSGCSPRWFNTDARSADNAHSESPATPRAVTEFQPLKCPDGEIFQPIFLSAIPDMNNFKVKDFDGWPIDSFGYSRPEEKYSVRLDLCSTVDGKVNFSQISFLEKSFDGPPTRLVLPVVPEKSRTEGVSEALFGDWSRLYVEVPLTDGNLLRIKALSNEGSPFVYATVLQQTPQKWPISSQVSVGVMELGDPFPIIKNGCLPDWKPGHSEFTVSGISFKFEFCSSTYVRATDYKLKSISISDPAVRPSDKFWKISSDKEGFDKQVRFSKSQHNWNDTLAILTDNGSQYEFTSPTSLTIKGSTGELRGPFVLENCQHFFTCSH